MADKITNLYKRFQVYYSGSTPKRVIVGLLSGGIFWIIAILISFVISLISNDTFVQTLAHDLVGIGLVFSLVVIFEIWGLIPHPSSSKF